MSLLSSALGVALALGSPAVPLVPAADQPVTFVVDGTTTYGTLHVPAHRPAARMPAALLLPGSGPTDRDGNQPGFTPNTLAKIAAALDVVTLRFDKYGSGQTGLGAYADDPSTIDYPAFVRQATAAYRLLAAQPVVDPHALRLIGHSEGGMTALVLATTVHPRPTRLEMLQPQSMRLLDVITRQLHDQLAAVVPVDQLPAIMLAIDNVVADFRAGRPLDTSALPASIAALFQALGGVNRRFVETDDAIEPAVVARSLPLSVRPLLTCGTADPQVPCDTTKALVDALRNPDFVVLQGVGHLLEDPDNPGSLAPSLLAVLG